MHAKGGSGEKSFSAGLTLERFFLLVSASHMDGNVGQGFSRFWTTGCWTFVDSGVTDEVK